MESERVVVLRFLAGNRSVVSTLKGQGSRVMGFRRASAVVNSADGLSVLGGLLFFGGMGRSK